jgi:hypothetical protein
VGGSHKINVHGPLFHPEDFLTQLSQIFSIPHLILPLNVNVFRIKNTPFFVKRILLKLLKQELRVGLEIIIFEKSNRYKQIN